MPEQQVDRPFLWCLPSLLALFMARNTKHLSSCEKQKPEIWWKAHVLHYYIWYCFLFFCLNHVFFHSSIHFFALSKPFLYNLNQSCLLSSFIYYCLQSPQHWIGSDRFISSGLLKGNIQQTPAHLTGFGFLFTIDCNVGFSAVHKGPMCGEHVIGTHIYVIRKWCWTRRHTDLCSHFHCKHTHTISGKSSFYWVSQKTFSLWSKSKNRRKDGRTDRRIDSFLLLV